MSIALAKRAIKERWPITPAHRENVVQYLTQYLLDEDPKMRLRAIELFQKLDKLNLDAEKIQVMKQPKHLIHTNLSQEELIKQIKSKMEELGLPEEGVRALLSYEQGLE